MSGPISWPEVSPVNASFAAPAFGRTARPLDRVESLDAEIASLTKTRDQALVDAQASCPHPSSAVRKGAFVDETWIANAKPSFLVCVDCGLAEDGWGFYDVFRAHYSDRNIPEISREDAWKFVRTYRDRTEVDARLYPRRAEQK